MPFGLSLPSIVLGMLLAWYVLPYVMGLFARNRTSSANPVAA